MAYFMAVGNERRGPYETNQLLAAGLRPETLVWTDGMAQWQRADAVPELRALLQTSAAPPATYTPPAGTYGAAPAAPTRQVTPSYQSSTPVVEQVAALRSNYKTYWLCLAIGLPLCLICIGFPIMIVGFVYYFILLYKFWSLVQPSQRCSSPGQAIGFMFIPFFNLYWMFVAILGLAKELNAYRSSRGIPGMPVSEGMAQTVCILTLCSIIPYLGVLVGLVNTVVTILLMKQFTEAAVDILQTRDQQASLPVAAATV